MIYKNSKWVWESNDWYSTIRRQVTQSGLVTTTSNKALFVDGGGSYFTTLHMVYSILNILRLEQFYHFWSSISVSDFHKLKQQHIHIKCGHALLLLKTFLAISGHLSNFPSRACLWTPLVCLQIWIIPPPSSSTLFCRSLVINRWAPKRQFNHFVCVCLSVTSTNLAKSCSH